MSESAEQNENIQPPNTEAEDNQAVTDGISASIMDEISKIEVSESESEPAPAPPVEQPAVPTSHVVSPPPQTAFPSNLEIAHAAPSEPEKLSMLMDISLLLAVELGRTRMTVREVLDLQKGSVVELDRMAGESVDILVNEHLMARGEVVVVDDKFGVRITEVITNNKKNGD